MEGELSKRLFHLFEDPLFIVTGEGTVVHRNEAAKKYKKAEYLIEGIKHNTNPGKNQYLLLPEMQGHKLLHEAKVLTVSEKYKAVLLRKASLKEEIAPLSKLKKGSREGTVIFDEERIYDCDSGFSRFFNKQPEDIIGSSIYEFLKYGPGDYLHAVKAESIFEVLGRTSLPGLEKAWIMSIREEENREQAVCPGLLGRKAFVNLAKRLIDDPEVEELAIYTLDLDHFRQINDTLGYGFGEKLIAACGERLEQLNNEKVTIGHLGGDEFLVCSTGNKDRKEIEEFAERLLDKFRLPFNIDEHEITISLRIGISTYPHHAKTVDELLRQADSAMYQLKEQRTNDYQFYSASISKSFEALLSMEADLSKARELKEFEVHYQPQTNIETGEIIGCEALLRWNHSQKGYIPPGVFIPVLEKNNQINEMGEWILQQACHQNKKWQDEGCPPIVVSVNLSAKQLHDPDLVSTVRKALKDSELAACYLELEITESMAMTNETTVLKTLQELRHLGVQVSIDDFGTGYSSLQYLSRFPVNKLKIDKVFLHENKGRNEAIVKSIIHMSHALNLRVIAEGIETEEQLKFLQSEKCDEGQGYFFSKPLPAHETKKWMTQVGET
ncbi:putative bifunctional diguanylate cyclase/phosphodiesterase [Salimicrobium halophilum]|uniref:Diguanylate cyclase (GGDEF) domain-containing protein n=1 Tax=Salimicrobium halophilum TaxID=86666 RepID=A0A1G8RN20_9BACI|nr:bifunctional diguanylate cyclase/phosphodiesterase [Salimicrobium halophilum]SDJ18398.1 diguanylate cyclase (GGDEF) domain-containing protein [Salimicrobium halophilum]